MLKNENNSLVCLIEIGGGGANSTVLCTCQSESCPPGHPQDYDTCPSDHTGNSDNILSDIKNGRNINILGGDCE